MKENLNIAVIGLSLNALDQIKNQILFILPAEIQVQWVNIAEQNIDLLLVNDAFFSSPSIQKSLMHHDIPYLRLIKSVEQGGNIIDDALFYPITRLNELREWIQARFLGHQTHDFRNTPAIRHSIPATDVTPVNHISDILAECLMPRNGFIQLFDASGFVALVDTMTERVWSNTDNPILSFDQSLNQTYATNQFVQEVIKTRHCQDLRNWLWQVTYCSNALDFPEINFNQYFKLKIWPQFTAESGRKDLLRLSACFAQGAKIQAVANELDISPQVIIKFVTITQMLNMGTWIESHEAHFMGNDKSSETNQMIKIRGFFGKLRKKLGL